MRAWISYVFAIATALQFQSSAHAEDIVKQIQKLRRKLAEVSRTTEALATKLNSSPAIKVDLSTILPGRWAAKTTAVNESIRTVEFATEFRSSTSGEGDWSSTDWLLFSPHRVGFQNYRAPSWSGRYIVQGNILLGFGFRKNGETLGTGEADWSKCDAVNVETDMIILSCGTSPAAIVLTRING